MTESRRRSSVAPSYQRADLSARHIRHLTGALAEVQHESRRPELTMARRARAVVKSLTNLTVAVLIANDAGRYIDVNRAASQLTGYTRRELLTRSVWDLTPNVRQTLGRRLWREFLERGRMSGVYTLGTKKGGIVRARYVAVANVLPGIHVSALSMAPAASAARDTTSLPPSARAKPRRRSS
jgi:PAS domain S-box-containing protein